MISKMIIFLTVVSLACAAVWMGKPPKKPHNLGIFSLIIHSMNEIADGAKMAFYKNYIGIVAGKMAPINKLIEMFTSHIVLEYFFNWMPHPLPNYDKNKEGCYIREINDVISYNDEISPIGYCVRIECGKDFIHYASCGVVVTDDPKCHITETDLHRPYPDCCPKINCELDNNLV